MTVKECYEQMGADYEGVLGRLRSEVLIKKFAKKFLDDGSFRSLKDNLVQKNGEEAFRAAHTLKGVCQIYAINTPSVSGSYLLHVS